jgi:hypothetical protein
MAARKNYAQAVARLVQYLEPIGSDAALADDARCIELGLQGSHRSKFEVTLKNMADGRGGMSRGMLKNEERRCSP